MFILIYFLVVALSQFITNKLLGISDDNEDSYSYNKKDSLILIILFIIGIILQILTKYIKTISKYTIWFLLLYTLSILVVMLVFSTIKKHRVEKQREEISQVYEILQRMVDRKNEGLDFNNVPFKLGYKYGNINKIDVVVEPTSFDEKILSMILQQLNAFLPTFTWGYELHLEERYMTFIGHDKPPNLARWPGSWLRHFRFMPVGISGKGEVAWQPDSVPKNRMGHSQYLDEKGNPIPTDTSLPKQPQGLVAGAPLSLNTIIPTTAGYETIMTIKPGDFVFDLNNKPTKVISKSELFFNRMIYKLTFMHDCDKIILYTDEIHNFPVKNNDKYIEKQTKDLEINKDIVLGNYNINYRLVDKVLTDSNEPVQCILTDSDNHLFLVTDKKQPFWQGGNKYLFDAIYTRNTGGGKAIWIEQEIN